MKKISMIAILTTILTLFSSGLSYAAPAQEQPGQTAEASQINLTPELVTQAITELKAAGIPHETVHDAKEVKTTFHFEQGLSFTLVEPAAAPSVSAFVGGGWRWGQGPYITLSPRDQDFILGGSGALLMGAICSSPAVGWAVCSISGYIISETVKFLQGRKVCGNRDLEVAIVGFSARIKCK